MQSLLASKLLDPTPSGGTTTPSNAGGPQWRLPKWRAFSAIGITYITTVFATAFAFLALPKIAEDFDVTLGAVGWVVIVESLLIAALLLPLGGLADLLGDKRVLSIGLLIFGLGTLLTGISPTFVALIGARMVMAVGNALVQSVATGLVVSLFPDHERGLAMGAQTASVAVGSASAPLLGGLGLEFLSWSTIFLLLFIPTAISWFAVRALIPNRPLRESDAKRTFDVRGSVLSALAIIALVVTISNPFSLAWLSPGIIGGAIAAIGLLALFIGCELKTEHPMLELRLFAEKIFRTSVALRTFGFLASAPSTLLLPVYLLSFREVSASSAGIILAALAIGLGSGAQVAGRLYDRIGPRTPVLGGFALQVSVLVWLSFSDETTSLILLGVLTGLSGLSIGFWNVPSNSATLGAMPAAFLGVGGAFTNLARTFGTVVGQALAAAVVSGVMVSRGFDIPLGDLANNPDAGFAFIDGWQLAYLIAAALSASLILVATRLPSKGQAGR